MVSKKFVLIIIFIISTLFIAKYNYILLQKTNAAYLIDIGQTSRVFPHRVNSINKLRDIWSDGIRSFEVDIQYGYKSLDEFQVGHDKAAMGDSSLEELFLAVENQEIERVWLDLKNISDVNYLKVLHRLEYLEKKFNVKNKILLESSSTQPFFRKFPERGWKISYYLPTHSIIKLLENNDIIQLRKMALKIARQSEVQKLSAFSFDERLYPFVKGYLEPLISDNIVYHTWWGPSLKRYNFKSSLLANKLFHDQRVMTILVRYKSRYHI